MSDQKEIIAIVDQCGRTVVGVETGSTAKTLTLNNPVIVHVQPDPQNGQLQVQTFPYLFMEFIDGDKTKNDWLRSWSPTHAGLYYYVVTAF